MLYHKQLIFNRPEQGQYGDCFRTAIACLLDLSPEQVPHFFERNTDADKAWKACEEFLNSRGLSLFVTIFAAENIKPNEIIERVSFFNDDKRFLLFGRGRDADHVVVCRNGKIEHDPSLLDVGISGPSKEGNYYLVGVIVPRNINL